MGVEIKNSPLRYGAGCGEELVCVASAGSTITGGGRRASVGVGVSGDGRGGLEILKYPAFFVENRAQLIGHDAVAVDREVDIVGLLQVDQRIASRYGVRDHCSSVDAEVYEQLHFSARLDAGGILGVLIFVGSAKFTDGAVVHL